MSDHSDSAARPSFRVGRWISSALIAIGVPKCVGCVVMYLSLGTAVELCDPGASSVSWPVVASLTGVAGWLFVCLRARGRGQKIARAESVFLSQRSTQL